MPVNIKLTLSVVLVIVGIIVGYWQARLGQTLNMWLAPFLACIMVFAIWLFPEAGGKDGDKRRGRGPRSARATAAICRRLGA